MRANLNLEPHYKVLGLAPGSALAAIKKAYLQEIKIWHPDRYSPDSILRGNAEERTKALTAAYAALTAALKASNQEGAKRETAPEPREGLRQQETSESAPRPEEEPSIGKWIGRLWRRLKAQWNPDTPSPTAAAPHKKGAPRRRSKPSRHPRFDDVLEAARKGPQTPADISVVRRRLAARRARKASGARNASRARYGRRSGSSTAPIEPIKSRRPVPPVDRIRPIGKDS